MQARLPLAVRAGGLQRSPAAFFQRLHQRLIGLRINHQPVARHGAQQMMELGLDRSQVGKNVCVIKFHVVHHQRARPVVDKLRALVKKRAVIFVRFHDKKIGAAQTGRDSEILRHAANQKTGLHAGLLQNPCQHAGRSGFTVGAGHRQHPLVLQYMPGQPLGAGHIGHATIEYMLYRRVAA